MDKNQFKQHPLDFHVIDNDDTARAAAANTDGVAPTKLFAAGEYIICNYEYIKAGNYQGEVYQLAHQDKAIIAAFILARREPKSDKANQRKLSDCRKAAMSADTATRALHLNAATRVIRRQNKHVAKINMENIKTIVQTGDVWQLGNHTLYCDSNKNIQTSEADMMITDPPYLVNYANTFTGATASIRTEIAGDNTTEFELAAHLLTKAGAAAYIFFAGSKMSEAMKAISDAKWIFNDFLIWDKLKINQTRMQWGQDKEPILFCQKHGKAHRQTKKLMPSIFKIKRQQKNSWHQTQKPVKLIEKIINNHSLPEDVVIDPFLGGGSTLIACENTGRRCIGIELQPRYCDGVIARWEAHTSQKSKLIKRNGKDTNSD